ncbi:uncharacterized protein LOC107036427 isoform X2 [Diachasma alloeum]|uniref:uncharacterized protein LOC107036427 isoform X2 n=1 Tax=Diachasma alloeum TaxID=454923 RepID=UPI000738274C|nr:uncharacterized protein LOC107036427 isoform X2 [Diachasma alloeum]
MEKELLKALVGFFSALERTEGKWAERCQGVQANLEGLKNFSEQREHVFRDVDDAEICGIGNVRERLGFKIEVRMEEEISGVRETVQHLGELNQELKNKLVQLEKVRSKAFVDDPKMKEIVEGTPHRPRLNLLLEWAIDAQDYYQQRYHEINESFKAVDKTKRETILELIETFGRKGDRALLNRILGFTQYLAREKIR